MKCNNIFADITILYIIDEFVIYKNHGVSVVTRHDFRD